MKRLILLLSFWSAATLAAFGQVVPGRYQATLNLGPDKRQALVLVLNTEESSVNGSIWPDAQHPLFFKDGTVNRNEISFSAGGIDTKLTIDGTTLRGFASPHGGSVKWPFEAKRIGDLTLEDRFPPLLNEIGSIRSQRILSLRESLHRGVPDAENSFWTQIQSNLKRALSLPAEERAALANTLLDSLAQANDQADDSVEAAWDKEVARRMKDLDAGRSVTVPWEELRLQLLATLNAL